MIMLKAFKRNLVKGHNLFFSQNINGLLFPPPILQNNWVHYKDPSVWMQTPLELDHIENKWEMNCVKC